MHICYLNNIEGVLKLGLYKYVSFIQNKKFSINILDFTTLPSKNIPMRVMYVCLHGVTR